MKAILNPAKFLILLMVICQLQAIPSLWSSTYPTIAFPCTSYCKYNIDSNNNLSPDCSQAAAFTVNGGCTDCDALLFVLQQGFCIPHLYNLENEIAYFNYDPGVNVPFSGAGTNILGFYTATGASNSRMFETVSGLPPHFATRIRFSAYFYANSASNYFYPLGYAMDSHAYTYNQIDTNYYS
jgi:hypothetical protein